MWILSKHCEISLIHASLSWAVGATRWIECLCPDFPSTIILKSRLFALTGSLTLKLLFCVVAEQSDSSSSLPDSLGSSISVASTSGIFPTSGSKWRRPAEVLGKILIRYMKVGCHVWASKCLNTAFNLIRVFRIFENLIFHFSGT